LLGAITAIDALLSLGNLLDQHLHADHDLKEAYSRKLVSVQNNDQKRRVFPSQYSIWLIAERAR